MRLLFSKTSLRVGLWIGIRFWFWKKNWRFWFPAQTQIGRFVSRSSLTKVSGQLFHYCFPFFSSIRLGKKRFEKKMVEKKRVGEKRFEIDLMRVKKKGLLMMMMSLAWIMTELHMMCHVEIFSRYWRGGKDWKQSPIWLGKREMLVKGHLWLMTALDNMKSNEETQLHKL